MTGFRYWIYKSKIYSDSAIVNDLLKIYGSVVWMQVDNVPINLYILISETTLVNDMYAENGDDEYKGDKELAIQEDFDRF